MSDGDKAVLDYATKSTRHTGAGARLTTLAIVFLATGYGCLLFVLGGWDFLFYGQKNVERFIPYASPIALLVALILSISAQRFVGAHRRRNGVVLLLSSLTFTLQVIALFLARVC